VKRRKKSRKKYPQVIFKKEDCIKNLWRMKMDLGVKNFGTGEQNFKGG
jgi:hypothetical protein